MGGRVYYYKYHPPSTTAGDGHFDLVATHVATGGNGARYTMITHTGDIVVCNDSRTDPVLPGANSSAPSLKGTSDFTLKATSDFNGTLTVLKGLALNPLSNPEIVTIDTVPTVQFFFKVRSCRLLLRLLFQPLLLLQNPCSYSKTE